MFSFRILNSHEPLLDASPLMRSLDFLKAEFEGHTQGIRLTKNLFFNLKLIERAIPAIDWPEWGVEEIYHRFHKVKVAHEDHFEPLMIVHDALLNLKLVRRLKGHLVLTPFGRKIFAERYQLFDLLAQHLILEHGFFWQSRSSLLGSWDIWLNVIADEARQQVSGADLRTVFYGPPVDGFDREQSNLRDGVLLPLVWIGLLDERFENGRKLPDRTYQKTELWDAYLKLDELQPHLSVVR